MQPICLFIGIVWPEPTSSAAGTRILQLISLFQEQGYKVVFASSAQKSEFSFNLKSINVDEEAILLNDDSFNDFVANLNPEIVVFDRFYSEEQFGWRVVQECPNALLILDTEDLHCLRQTRQEKVKKNLEFKTEDLLESEIAIREIASIYRCDLSLIISEIEMEVLQNTFSIPKDLIYYLPLFYEQKSYVKTYNERTDFVFIGNFMHEPNWDAVKVLKTEIWPQLRKKLPQAKLIIYGAYPTQKVFDLHNEKEGFLIKGRAENALEVLENARALLAPIRFGAGQKGKILEAISVGTPFVSTSIGIEGIYENNEIGVEIEDFVEKASCLYENESLWNKTVQTNTLILKNFKRFNYEQDFANTILNLQENRHINRNKNFIGKILKHNTVNSLKYMSLWINEKNKKFV